MLYIILLFFRCFVILRYLFLLLVWFIAHEKQKIDKLQNALMKRKFKQWWTTSKLINIDKTINPITHQPMDRVNDNEIMILEILGIGTTNKAGLNELSEPQPPG